MRLGLSIAKTYSKDLNQVTTLSVKSYTIHINLFTAYYRLQYFK